MGVPFELGPMVNEPFTGGVARVLKIGCPSRALINKIIIKQMDGVLATFTVELFNNGQVFTGIPTSDSAGPYVGKVPEDCYRVTPVINSDAAGTLVHFSENATGGHGYAFVCTDVDLRNFKSQGSLYLRITPAGSGAMLFAIAIGGESQVGGA